ncbi:MAG: hypothetical protein KC445_08505 [Anaerolineales bacterium]|nr:hypothetical protein [Anaerolineales bacterium]
MKHSTLLIALLLPFALLFSLGQVVNGRVQAKPQLINVGGTISTDTTWTADNSPYVLTDTITVQTGVTLTIEAGVVVQTPDTGDYLDVQGHLEAVGTAVNPILFTSIDDLPANNWSGISVSGSANFEQVTMRYAYTALFLSGGGGGVVSLTDSTMEENLVYPIVVNTDALHRLTMNNITFSNNVPDRVGINKSHNLVDNLTLAGNVLLTPQPGLEGYEDLGNGSTSQLIVPQGITLTFVAGTTFMSDSAVIVDGQMIANGTALEPVILDDRPGGGNFMFNYFVVGGTGSASISHTIIRDGPLGLGIGGQSDLPIILQDVVLDNVGEFPILVEAPSLHRLQMTNVTFQNSTYNRVVVDTDGGQAAIAADVTLTTQPGLEWYEFADGSDPQTLPAEFVVPDGITLTVEPSVELRFGSGAETMVVNGRLQAIGTPTSPITFTSAADSAPGQWEGIVVENGSAHLEYTEVRYGTANLTVNNTAVSTPVVLQNSQLRLAAMDGLLVLDGAVTAVCSHLSNNNGSGVFVLNSGQPVVKILSSALVGNGDAGLTNQNASVVDARYSWWGDASGPAGIGPGTGAGALGNVLFDPWLEEDVCTTMPYRLYLPAVTKT